MREPATPAGTCVIATVSTVPHTNRGETVTNRSDSLELDPAETDRARALEFVRHGINTTPPQHTSSRQVQ